MSAMGSSADILQRQGDVRITPDSEHILLVSGVTFMNLHPGTKRKPNSGRRHAFRNPGRRSLGLRIVLFVRPPELREVPAEVQFEVARNAVTDTPDLGAARLRTGQGQR